MRVLIIGAGAIGCWLGAHLVQVHHDVTLVGRQKIVDGISNLGLQVTQASGRQWGVRGFRCATSVDEATLHTESVEVGYDVVIFTVKAYSLTSAVHEVERVWERITRRNTDQRDATFLVCFQNGVGCEEEIADVFGGDHVVSATTTSPVSMSPPGIVREERSGGTVCVAPVIPMDTPDHMLVEHIAENRLQQAVQDQFISVLKNTGLDIRRYDNHRSLKWSKMLLNMLGNATGAILDLPASVLYRDARVYDLEVKMLRETRTVMKHLGIAAVNLPRFPAGLLSTAVAWAPGWLLKRVLEPRLVQGRGGKRPSFYYDIVRKNGQCEVAWLNGAVARYGAEMGIQTPANRKLTEVLTDLVTGREALEDWRGNVAKLVDGL